MINLRFIKLIIDLISIGLAYVFSATTAGYTQAWIAKKMGDDTPEQAGFLTWNPLVHVDPIGAFFLLSMGIGWMRFIPIDPSAIRGRWRLAAVYFCNLVVYLLIALCALVILLRIFGLSMLGHAIPISLETLQAAYPETSSLMLSFALVLLDTLYLGIVFAVLYFVIDGFRFLLLVASNDTDRLQEGDMLSFIIPFILIVLVAPTLRVYAIYAVSLAAYYIAHILGAG
jgi:hypothetical protein